MKSFLFGVLLIVIIGIGGLMYRNAIEYPSRQIACPMDALVCPDGTSVGREGLSCTFPACPPPNITLADIGISFAVPSGFGVAALPDSSSIAAYDSYLASSPETTNSIVIRRYAIEASSTPLAAIQKTAIGGASGIPVSPTSFTSTTLGSYRFTVVSIERFEGVIDTAYYLARNTDVLRFDAIDRGADWTNPSLNVSSLPAHSALEKMLTTLQGQ